MTDKPEKKEEAPKGEVGRFVGPRKVVAVAIDAEVKTPGGKEVVNIMYEGGFSERMPKSTFEVAVAEVPSDYNALRIRKFAPLLKDVIAVIVEHDIKAEEIEHLKQGIESELFNSFNRATHYLWTKDDKSFTPGANVVLERSLLEADVVIKSIEVKEEKKDDTITKPKTEGEDK